VENGEEGMIEMKKEGGRSEGVIRRKREGGWGEGRGTADWGLIKSPPPSTQLQGFLHETLTVPTLLF
jgi:hypothetical protein